MIMTTQITNYPVNLRISEKNGNPSLEIRKITTNSSVIKIIIDAAMTGKPIIVFPTFRDRMRALGTLQEKKIIKYNSEKQCYDFLI